MKRYFLASVVFFVMLAVGFMLAAHKPMANDEYFSTVSSIENISYTKMFSGKIPEGNNSPLFYTFQKILIDITPYDVPSSWINGKWDDVDLANRLVLRINPVLFMSLSIALIFHFFSARFHWAVGLLSVFVYVSTYILWPFWAEARPYAMLVFLTTAQSLCLVKVIESNGQVGLKRLIATNIFLSLTAIFSLGLIAATTVIMGLYRVKHFKQYCMAMVLPVIAILYYYTQAPRYSFYFDLTPEQLIRDNIGRERFYIFIAFLVCWTISVWQKKQSAIKDVLPYFKYLLGALLMTAALITMFKMGAKTKEGFPVSSRYFIYLMPIGVIASVWACVTLHHSLSRWRFAQYALWVFVAALFIPRFFKIVPSAIRSHLG